MDALQAVTDSRGSTALSASLEASARRDRGGSPQRLSDDGRGAFDVGAADVEMRDRTEAAGAKSKDPHAGHGQPRRDRIRDGPLAYATEHYNVRLAERR